MSTSKPPNNPHNNNLPPGGSAPNSYTRFIPREELGGFTAWAPDAFEQQPQAAGQDDGGVRRPTLAERAAAEMRPPMKPGSAKHAPQAMGGAPAQASAQVPRAAGAGAGAKPGQAKPTAAAPRPTPVKRPIVGGVPGENDAQAQAEQAQQAKNTPPAPNVDELVNEARQTGYQDGYRNGLAALESYKQTQAVQMAAFMSDQVGVLASDFHHRLESLEQQLAGRIAGVALELARQVVRHELRQNPEVVVEVADQALGALLASARQIVLRLHPDDHAMTQSQLAEVLAARGARVVPDATIARGGCIVESDIAVVDASVEARWDAAAAGMGHHAPWNHGKEALGSTEVRLPEGEDELDDWPESEADVTAEPREEGQA